VLLHLCQPTKPGTKELEKMKLNGAVMYRVVDQVSKLSFSLSLSLCLSHARKDTRGALKIFEPAKVK
jgi:hypothetical protein